MFSRPRKREYSLTVKTISEMRDSARFQKKNVTKNEPVAFDALIIRR